MDSELQRPTSPGPGKLFPPSPRTSKYYRAPPARIVSINKDTLQDAQGYRDAYPPTAGGDPGPRVPTTHQSVYDDNSVKFGSTLGKDLHHPSTVGVRRPSMAATIVEALKTQRTLRDTPRSKSLKGSSIRQVSPYSSSSFVREENYPLKEQRCPLPSTPSAAPSLKGHHLPSFPTTPSVLRPSVSPYTQGSVYHPPVSPYPEGSVYAVHTGFKTGVLEYARFRAAVNGYEAHKVCWAIFRDTKHAELFVKTGKYSPIASGLPIDMSGSHLNHLKPQWHVLRPLHFTQPEPLYTTKTPDRCTPSECTPLNAQYTNAGIPSTPPHSDLYDSTDRRRSPNNEVRSISSTGATTESQLAGGDSMSIPENIHPNPANCDGSEGHKLACGVGIDYLATGTKTHREVQQFDRFDHPPDPVLPNTTTDSTVNPVPDPRTQDTKTPDQDNGDAPMDQEIQEDNNRIVAFKLVAAFVAAFVAALVVSLRGISATPTVSPCHPTVDQNAGSLNLPVPTEALSKDYAPNKHQINTQSPSPSSYFHRPFRWLLAMPTGKYSYILAAVVKFLTVLRTPEEQDPALHPDLAAARSSARSCQLRFRITRTLALLRYHSLSWEPGGSGFSFEYGGSPGSNQGPGGIDWRLEDGSDIWSGQGPGPELSSLQVPEESLIWSDILQLLGQEPDDPPSKPTHDPVNSSVSQQPDYSPPPPVPLDSYFAGYSAGHSAGYSEGVAHVYAAFTHFMESTIQQLINHTASIQSSGAPTATDMLKTALLAGLDALARNERVTATNPEPLSSTECQSMSLNFSDFLPQNFATQVAPNTEHETSILDADLNSSSNHVGLDGVLNSEAQPPARFDSLTLTDISPTNGLELSSIPATQMPPSQWIQQPSVGPESSPIPCHEGAKTSKHQCDSCGKLFRRPHLLEDHKRIHTGEETSIYPCKFKGCTRVYKSHTNMNRHFKSHFRGANSRGPLPASNGQMLEGTSEQSPIAGPSIQNAMHSAATQDSDRGTSTLSEVRFRPYETPDTVRRKAVPRQK